MPCGLHGRFEPLSANSGNFRHFLFSVLASRSVHRTEPTTRPSYFPDTRVNTAVQDESAFSMVVTSPTEQSKHRTDRESQAGDNKREGRCSHG